MPTIHEVATLTSKGQITLPKPIRQALGVHSGGKVAFDLHGSHVVVTRVEDAQHQDPAIEHFLHLLEQDIQHGRHITTLPANLAHAMLSAIRHPNAKNEEIEGDVAL